MACSSRFRVMCGPGDLTCVGRIIPPAAMGASGVFTASAFCGSGTLPFDELRAGDRSALALSPVGEGGAISIASLRLTIVPRLQYSYGRESTMTMSDDNERQ